MITENSRILGDLICSVEEFKNFSDPYLESLCSSWKHVNEDDLRFTDMRLSKLYITVSKFIYIYTQIFFAIFQTEFEVIQASQMLYSQKLKISWIFLVWRVSVPSLTSHISKALFVKITSLWFLTLTYMPNLSSFCMWNLLTSSILCDYYVKSWSRKWDHICRRHTRITALWFKSRLSIIFDHATFYPHLIPERTWSLRSRLTCP